MNWNSKILYFLVLVFTISISTCYANKFASCAYNPIKILSQTNPTEISSKTKNIQQSEKTKKQKNKRKHQPKNTNKDSTINFNVYKSVIRNGDTIAHIDLPNVIITANKQEITWRLIYNVKKVYPYAKLAGKKYKECIACLDSTERKRERRRIIRQIEKELKEDYVDDLKQFTISQGDILFKLISRETGIATYEIIKELKGGFHAFMFQSVGKIFGYNLKDIYDPKGKDNAIENVVWMIEKGTIEPIPLPCKSKKIK